MKFPIVHNRFLFRGKRLENSEDWVYGAFLKHHARQLSTIGDSYKDGDIVYLILKSGFADWNMSKPIDAFLVDPATVGQCTGIIAAKSYRGESETDRLIFEGDIVNCICHGTITSKGEIRWNEQYCSWSVWLVGFDLPEQMRGKGNLKGIDFHYEIIGNIWDNPELVEVGNK